MNDTSLKVDPMFKQDKVSVSWHADSTLDHFSTIAVYHFTQPKSSELKGLSVDHADAALDDAWKVALRVWYDAEGPNAGKHNSRSEEMKSNCVAPPVAFDLPNNSAYFLLDDFNHHHQHSGERVLLLTS